MKVNPETRGEH